MKYGRIFTYENRDEAKIGKWYIFSDNYTCIYDERVVPSYKPLKLMAVRNDSYPFETESGAPFQFIREVIEEPVLQMTNYEKMKSMSINELANFFCDKLHSGCESCRFYFDCHQSMNMGIGIKQWLEAEATE